jgi:hypothetical protein
MLLSMHGVQGMILSHICESFLYVIHAPWLVLHGDTLHYITLHTPPNKEWEPH